MIKIKKLKIIYSFSCSEENIEVYEIYKAVYNNCIIFDDNKYIYVTFKNKNNCDYEYSYTDKYNPKDIIDFQFFNEENNKS